MEFKTLETLFNSHLYRQEFQLLTGHFGRVKQQENITELEAIYQQVIRRYENLIWLNKIPNAAELSVYQKLFREMEQVIGHLEEDNRSHFFVVIPVADSPQQLKSCLQSLYSQCQLYHYGGVTEGVFNKINIVIADDSQQEDNILAHRQLAGEYTQLGMECEYFGLEQQSEILAQLSDAQRQSVAALTGCGSAQSVPHKGASAIRNLTYLRLVQIANEITNPLFFFVDSDHELLAKVNDNGIEKNLHAINYFYHFEHIFREKQIKLLTGRVTGNPPVSPTVMIGNFLEDVIAFLQRMVLSDPSQDCYFHDIFRETGGDEAYHDMAELFGYYPSKKAYDYHCPLETEHTLEDTLIAFSRELDTFFQGEHPTRMIFYHYDIVRNSVQPSRTVYTSNYVFGPEALEYFIPFASLNLRMAGPVLGRILKRELGQDFLIANTPLLHKSVLDDVDNETGLIDLTEEYQRQFFGDIMLFSVQKLLEKHELGDLNDRKTIADAVFQTRDTIRNRYSRQQYNVMKSLTVLEGLLRLTGVQAVESTDDENHELVKCGQRFLKFVDNVKHNFSADSANYALLQDDQRLNDKCEQLVLAIEQYGPDRDNWRILLEEMRKRPG